MFRPRDHLNEPSFSVSIEDFADEPSCSSSADKLQFSLQKDEDCNTEGEGEKLLVFHLALVYSSIVIDYTI